MSTNKFKIICFFAVLGLIVPMKAHAQSGQSCASISMKQLIGKDTVEFTVKQLNEGIQLTCDTAKRTLIAERFAQGMPDELNGYTYERIAYDPPAGFNEGERINLPVDDCWSKLFDFDHYFPVEGTDNPPFRFYFYDNAYNSVIANSNGGVAFVDPDRPIPIVQYASDNKINLFSEPTNKPDEYVPCPFMESNAFPDSRSQWTSASPVMNSINGPFQDINYNYVSEDAKKGCFINFIGEYPCRRCIISFNQIPMFGNCCGDSIDHTSMIVLYETTNTIEFYIKQKPYWTSTNNSNAILGIQNIDGTQACTITNDAYDPDKKGTTTTQSYNNTKWKAKNEAWRIKPTGELYNDIAWFKKTSKGAMANQMQPVASDGNNQVIAVADLNDGPTWFYCRMNVTRNEDAREFALWDSILIIPSDVPAATLSHNSSNAETSANNADSLSLHDTICAGDQVIFRLTGGDEYHFVEPAELANNNFVGGAAVVSQSDETEYVFYKFQILNYKDGQVICTRYDSCYIHVRKPELNIGADTNICSARNVLYQDTIKTHYGKFTWTYGEDNMVIGNDTLVDFVPMQSGRLTLQVKDSKACKASASAQINVISYPVVTIEGKTSICHKTSTVLTAVSDAQSVTYSWNNGTQTAANTVSPDQTTEFTVSVETDTAQCKTDKSVTVTVIPIPTVELSQDERMCEQEIVSISVEGDAQRYEWTSSDPAVNGGNLTQYEVSPESTTRYMVTGYNDPQLNCSKSDTMTVYVEKKPIPTIFFSPDAIDELSPIVVFADSTTGIVDRLWTISDGTTSSDKVFMHTFNLDDTTLTYFITLQGWSQYGCTDSVTTSISVIRDHHIWAPTGIYLHAQNPDNRTFRLRIDALQEFNLKIFNRWGTIVFETDDPEQGWDCTYNGENVNQGVYTWIAQYRHSDSPERVLKKTGKFMIYN